jgi:electron transfer flavoprotein alpha subunit
VPAAIGGTHEACAAGLLPRRLEVGLYGHAVAPRLLIALGLEGRAEDLAGFVKAAVVVSVGAGGADWADVVVAGDWRELVPRLAPLGAG